MSVSVLIPAYGAQQTIARAVQSALLQTVIPDEIIVISDDGQDYATLLKEAAISSEKLKFVSTGGKGTGVSHARNTGLKAASGSIIALLDSDDALAENYLEIAVPLAREHGAVQTQVRFIDDATGKELSNCGLEYASGVLQLEALYSACVHTYASMVYDRNTIEFGWNEKIPLLEDAVFTAECAARLGGVYYNAAPLYCYHHRAGSLCNSDDAPARFRKATQVIRQLIEADDICADDPEAQAILASYLTRNDVIELALEQAIKKGTAKHYQDFIRQNPGLLHTPLI